MTLRSDRSSASTDDTIAAVYRDEWGRLLSLLVARTRRLDLVEDALAEAFARATTSWPDSGVPTNPPGWLYRTAYRLVIDRLRSEAIAGRKAPLLATTVRTEPTDAPDVSDPEALGWPEELQLLFLCCHPALSPPTQSALALRFILGVSTDEIARLFLVSPSTMAARITRAKKKVLAARIPFGSPADADVPARLDQVCRSVYLAFTAAYTPSSGPELLRVDSAAQAVRLARVLHRLVPDAAQVNALVALVMFQHSRRDARLRQGRLVTLADQYRTLWHHDEITAAVELLHGLEPTSAYACELALQAHIAAEHATAPTAAATNWEEIARYYEALERLTGSPVVRLNRAVAVAEVDGPRAGLALLDDLMVTLPANHRLFAVRAELAARDGDWPLATSSYHQAITHSHNDVETAFLRSRLAELPASPRRSGA